MTRSLGRLLLAAAVAQLLLLATTTGATAGTFPLTICGSSARDPGDGLTWSSNAPLGAEQSCPAAGFSLSAPPTKTAGHNASGAFAVTAPSGIAVYRIHVVGAFSGGM